MRCWPTTACGWGRKRVERLMRAVGLQGAFVRKKWRVPSTVHDPRASPAPDRVRRVFSAAAPDRLWVADATRIGLPEGVLWLAAVRDAFSNRIVGWKTSDRCDTDLILAALEYAVWSRDVADGQVIHHSDHGSNCTSIRFADRLRDNGILASMGTVGDSFDNALMENFWSTLKSSWSTAPADAPATRPTTRSSPGSTWYNTRRIQAKLGYLSPDEYEAAWHAQHTQASQPATVAPESSGAR